MQTQVVNQCPTWTCPPTTCDCATLCAAPVELASADSASDSASTDSVSNPIIACRCACPIQPVPTPVPVCPQTDAQPICLGGVAPVQTIGPDNCPTWSCPPQVPICECESICAAPVALDSTDSASSDLAIACKCGCPVKPVKPVCPKILVRVVCPDGVEPVQTIGPNNCPRNTCPPITCDCTTICGAPASVASADSVAPSSASLCQCNCPLQEA